ncbi:MAG: GNAT family N-acetyltransferase [Proteobacteria bacterium]|nr:GNAT family N-acetyltransferase [Pseudomonadota bacterium]
MPPPLTLRVDDLSGEPVRRLLALHLAGMHEHSPPDAVHALDVSALQTPEITVWTAWRGAALAGMGALKDLGGDAAELKSFRTHPDHLRQGVAAAILDRIIDEARARGLRRLSLETGRGEAFEPALALYRSRGFAAGERFADYPPSDFSQFLHLEL